MPWPCEGHRRFAVHEAWQAGAGTIITGGRALARGKKTLDGAKYLDELRGPLVRRRGDGEAVGVHQLGLTRGFSA